jgi:hypothetical protein
MVRPPRDEVNATQRLAYFRTQQSCSNVRFTPLRNRNTAALRAHANLIVDPAVQSSPKRRRCSRIMECVRKDPSVDCPSTFFSTSMPWMLPFVDHDVCYYGRTPAPVSHGKHTILALSLEPRGPAGWTWSSCPGNCMPGFDVDSWCVFCSRPVSGID